MGDLRLRALERITPLTAKLPTGVHRVLAGRPVRIDGNVLDPQVQLSLPIMRRVGGDGSDVGLEEARRSVDVRSRVVRGRLIEMATVEDMAIPGAGGDLRARLYTPRSPSGDGLLVFFHGGGWTVGSIESHDQVCRFLASGAGTRVISVGYRLAPENPFPAAYDDAVRSYWWAVAHAAELHVDPAKVAVGGDSAGGNLAAAVANATADGPSGPAFQLLIYPVTDPGGTYPSHERFGEGFLLTTRERHWYNENYLGQNGVGADPSDPRAAPMHEPDLSAAPAAHVAVAGFDPLRDEGIAYAKRLEEAGVAVEMRLYPGLVHGYANAAAVSRAPGAAMAEAAAALRSALN